MHFLFSLWLLQARLIFHQGYCSIQISHSNVHRLIEYITLTFKAFSSLTRKTPGDDESDYIPQNTELIQPRTFILQVGFHDTICDFFYIHGLHPTQTVWCYSPNFVQFCLVSMSFFVLFRDLGNTVGRRIGVGPWCTWVGLCFFCFVLSSEFALLVLENKSQNPKERWMDFELVLPLTSPWCSSGSLTLTFWSSI